MVDPNSFRSPSDWLQYLDKIEAKLRTDQPGMRANAILSKLYDQAYEVLEDDWNDESYLVICIRKAVLTLYQQPASSDRDENFQSLTSVFSFNARGNAQLHVAVAYYYDLLGQKAHARSFVASKKRHSSAASYTNLLLEAERLLDNNQSLEGLIGKFHFVPPYPDNLKVLEYDLPNKPNTDRRRTVHRFTLPPVIKDTPRSVNSSEANDSLNFTSVTNLELSSRCSTTVVQPSICAFPNFTSTTCTAVTANSVAIAGTTSTHQQLAQPGLTNRPSSTSSDQIPRSSLATMSSSFCSCFSLPSSPFSCSLHSCSPADRVIFGVGIGVTGAQDSAQPVSQLQQRQLLQDALSCLADNTSNCNSNLSTIATGCSTKDAASGSVSSTLTSCQPKTSRSTRLCVALHLVSEVSIQPSEYNEVNTNNSLSRELPTQPLSRNTNRPQLSIPPDLVSEVIVCPVSTHPQEQSSVSTVANTAEEISTGDPRRDKENQKPTGAAAGSRFVVNGNTYLSKELIGRGGSSMVFAVEEDVQPHRRFALKLVSLTNASVDVVNAYCNEASMLRSLQDTDRVIRLHDCESTADSLALVMELAEISFVDLLVSIRKHQKPASSGEVDQVSRDRPGSTSLETLDSDGVDAAEAVEADNEAIVKPGLPLLTISFYWVEMLRCVQAIHDRRIVHLDLKLQNFVVVRGKLKLIDLGISQRLPDDMTRVGAVLNMGSLTYMSPEQLEGATALSSAGCSFFCQSPSAKSELKRLKVGRKADIWSLGVILYLITYLRAPFPQPNVQARMMAILNPELQVKFPQFGSQSLRQALQRCLVRDFRQRASLEELLRLPYPQ